MPFDEPIECPLCMEPLDIDDLNFYPCTCGYQICRFCWHRIRTDENSLCPACRKQYQEDPAEFKPLTEEELTKIKKERRQKDAASKQKAAESRRHLANIRVVQKNLVFVVGLSTRLADPEVLKRQDYFGKYGKILKVVINSSTSYAGAQGPSASAYITYTKPEDCLRAIHAVNNLYVDGRTLKASLGTTKYCSHFLKGTQCNKTDCMYLHELGDGEASFTKEEMQSGKHQDYEQKLVDTYLTPATINSSSAHPPAKTPAGDTTALTNGVSKQHSTSQRKKTDSGSSTGSSKPKEPWPLLNSNRNANAVSTTSKSEAHSVITDTTPDGSLSSSTTATPTLVTTTVSTLQNSTNHSSPSSTYSASSNPRTPTPETLPPTTSSRLPTTAPVEDRSSLNTEDTDPVAAPKTLLAVRKLPFSEPGDSYPGSADDSTAQDYASMYPNTLNSSNKPANVASNNTTQSPLPTAGAGTFGLSGFNKDSDTLLTAPSLDALQTYDQTAAASDDDLGFDPYIESNKGLADMLENENGHMMSPLMGFRGMAMPSMHHPRPPPGVNPHLHHNMVTAGGDMLNTGIISSSVTPSSPCVLPSSVVSSNASSTLPPPPPGLPAFPQYAPDMNGTSGHSSSTPPPLNTASGPDVPMFRGSRMLGLMNLGQNSSINQSPTPHNVVPVNPVPRSPYNDSRLGSVQPPTQQAFTGFSNGLNDYNNSFNTQELRDSLKALLPNASINFAPTHQPLQHSRLRNNYMQPGVGASQHSPTSWNGHSAPSQQQPIPTASSIDDQFTDPAIVSGCISTTDASGSPPGAQPHWLKSIQQLTEIDSSPVKQPTNTQPIHPMSMYNRQPPTHSRMPFAQNVPLGQPGNSNGNWPNFQPHNPPPGFPSPFRSTTQNSHMATLES